MGTLEFRTAVEPIRSRRNKSQYVQGWADGVDFHDKTVTIEEAVVNPTQGQALVECRNEGKDSWQLETERASKSRQGQVFSLHYDKLVIGVGCYNQTFNTPGVKENAHFLKDVGDARKIRRRLLECFETAALPTTSDEVRRQILHFAVVGGGPTGVEFSAELHDIIRQDMSRLYPELTQFVKITLYDVAPKVLTMFDKNLAKYANDTFLRQGITVKTSRKIQDLSMGLPGVDPYFQAGRPGLTLKVQDEHPTGIGMCIWSTGLMMNPFIEKALGAIRRFPPQEVVFKDNVEYAKDAKWHIARDKRTGSEYPFVVHPAIADEDLRYHDQRSSACHDQCRIARWCHNEGTHARCVRHRRLFLHPKHTISCYRPGRISEGGVAGEEAEQVRPSHDTGWPAFQVQQPWDHGVPREHEGHI